MAIGASAYRGGHVVEDLLVLLVAAIAFAATIAYVHACDRL